MLKHLQAEDTVAVLKDFFIDATLNQMTLGVQYWVEAVWNLDMEDAYAYIRKVHNKAVSGLEAIFDPNPGAGPSHRFIGQRQTEPSAERSRFGRACSRGRFQNHEGQH